MGDQNGHPFLLPDMNQKAKGYILGAIASATYGMNPLFTLPLYRDGMDTGSVLFLRYLIAVPFLMVMLKSRGRSFKLTGREALPLLFVGLFFALSSITLFTSYRYMDAGIASTILFVYPVMVALIMATFFKERISLQTWLCIFVTMLGVSLLYIGEGGVTLSLKGTLLVLGSALAYTLYMVIINKSSLKEVATIKVSFYTILTGLILFSVMLLFQGELILPSKWYLWGSLLALSIFPTVFSMICTTAAIKYIGSTPTALLGALEPATAIFFGVLVYGEELSGRDILGFLLIVASVSLVVSGSDFTSAALVRFRKLFPNLKK